MFRLSCITACLLIAIGFPTESSFACQDSNDELPRVLILGDSISMGYTPLVAEQLAGFANVSRPAKDGKAENCSGTIHGVANIDRWLADAVDVKLIFFNFGLHDLKHVDAVTKTNSNNLDDPRQSEPEAYEKQLTEIVEKLEATGARLVFVTTTPIPPGGVRPFRSLGDSQNYNAIARIVVEPRGIEVLDLYQPALDHIEQWQKAVDVHFNATGNEAFAELVAARARDILSKPAPTAASKVEPWVADPALVEKLASSGEFNYRESDIVPYELPALIDSNKIKSAEDWEEARPELIAAFADNMYGRPPAELADATSTFESRFIELPEGVRPMRVDEVTVSTQLGDDASFKFPFLLFQPPGEGPFPAIVLIHNREYPDVERTLNQPIGFLPVEMLIEQGFAVAVFYTGHVEPDQADAGTNGIRFACNQAFGDISERNDHWGCLTAWAWGASRVADFLAETPTIDANKIAVIGHSRGGKTALWAAAQDVRIAAAISNESGCAGAALSRRAYGETVARISSVFPYWFAPCFSEFAGRENALPVDQHQLIALIAPRMVAIGSASEDLWADPRGEYLSLVAAAPAFELLGMPSITDESMPCQGEQRMVGATSYHVRPGPHNLTEGDWLRYIQFLSNFWTMP